MKSSELFASPNELITDHTSRILIVEDHSLMAEGLQKLIEYQFPVVGITGNGETLLGTVATFKPDVVLMVMPMPSPNGIEAARCVRKIARDAKIIILTDQDRAEFVVEALRSGAVGYILTNCAADELIFAIREVLGGNSYITPKVSQHYVAKPSTQESREPAPLTARQREVLKLIAEGLTAKEIANVLHFSAKTAVFHKTAIMDKLGVRTTAELARYALEHGIVASRFTPIALPLPFDGSDQVPRKQPEQATLRAMAAAAQ